MYTSREPFLALTDLSWVTDHFSDITDTHVNCLHLDLDFKDMWPNLIYIVWSSTMGRQGDTEYQDNVSDVLPPGAVYIFF